VAYEFYKGILDPWLANRSFPRGRVLSMECLVALLKSDTKQLVLCPLSSVICLCHLPLSSASVLLKLSLYFGI
jgi:hypothetical protein